MNIEFPDPEKSTEEGIVCMGGQPHAANLRAAYRRGIFPWPHEGVPLLWFSPPQRGVIIFDEIHLPKTLKKTLRRNTFTLRFNTCFKDVVEGCRRAARKGTTGTWLTQEMVDGYTRAHEEGWAHSIEVFQGNLLCGGVYGVFPGTYFSAESMFFTVSSASKVGLIFLMYYLKKFGLSWLDVQMITPVTESMGGRYMDRSSFLRKIEGGLPAPTSKDIFPKESRRGVMNREEIEWMEKS